MNYENFKFDKDKKELSKDQIKEAKKILWITTFETRNNDSLDFKEYWVNRISKTIMNILDWRKLTEEKIQKITKILGVDIFWDNSYFFKEYLFKEYPIWDIKKVLELANK